MTTKPRDSSTSPTAEDVAPLDRVLFYILLGVLAARPLITESFERVELGFLGNLPNVGGPTPATTGWLDLLLLIAAVVALGRRGRWRRHRWPAVGFVLLVAAAFVSGSLQLMGMNLLVGVLSGLALATLIRRRWMLHLLVAAFLATGVATALKCILQRTDEFPYMRTQWEQQIKPQLIADGVDVDDPLIVNYERRLQARESTGYLTLSNITGSCLAMWIMLAIGLLTGSLLSATRSRPTQHPPRSEIPLNWLAPVMMLAVALILATALWFTGSLGAQVAAVVGVIVLVIGGAARGLAQRPRTVVAILAAGYFGVIGAVAVYGIAKGTLPHPSLAFRWYYWSTAIEAYQDAPLTGLGRGEFADAYLQYKPPESTEEVKDPHSVWLSLLVELGPLGLVGALVLLGTTLTASVRQLNPQPPDETPASMHLSPGALATRAFPAAAAVLLVHMLFAGLPLASPSLAAVWLADVVLPWLVGFGAVLWLLTLTDQSATGRRWLLAGLVAALFASLVHNALDLALMTPGGLAAFTLCAVAATGVRPPVAYGPIPSRLVRYAVRAALAVVVLMAVYGQFAIPVIQRAIDTQLQRLRQLMQSRLTPENAAELDRRAYAALFHTFGDDDLTETALRAAVVAGSIPELDARSRAAQLEHIIDRHAYRIDVIDTSQAHRLFARVLSTLADLKAELGNHDEATALRRRAAERLDRAVQRYPTDPRLRIEAGHAWLRVNQDTGAPGATRQAREHFAAALAIDDTRPPHEVQRLRPAERRRVEQQLTELMTPTAPATTPAAP